jgi:hypothetical protein
MASDTCSHVDQSATGCSTEISSEYSMLRIVGPRKQRERERESNRRMEKITNF